LRERDERAARKAAKKAQKAQQTEAGKGQQRQPAAIQVRTLVALPISTQNSQFHPQMHSSSVSPLLPGPDFTNPIYSSPSTPIFQGSSLTFPPQNSGGLWNQNQYGGLQNSVPAYNETQPSNWSHNQQHLPQSLPLSSMSIPVNQNVMGKVIVHFFFFLGS
jgi:hypothetical protein